MQAKSGQFIVDDTGRSIWTTSKVENQPVAGGGGGQSNQKGSGWKVEQYTEGKMCRDDDIVSKPVAAMSFGHRVRVGRIFKSHEEFLDKQIKVAGWVKSCRAQKDCCFIEVNDGSCHKGIQVVVASSSKDFAEISRTIVGASVSFVGTIIKSPAQGQPFELAVNDHGEHKAILIGNCDGTYPIQGRPSMDTLRQQQHLRARTNTFSSVARMRNALAYATHQFFQQRGFIYVHTPIITASDCEGAGEMFAVTTVLPEHDKPVTAAKLQTQLKTPKSAEELAQVAAKKKAEEEEAAKANEGKKKKKDKKKKGAEEKVNDDDQFNFTDIPLADQKFDYSKDMFGRPAFLSVSGQLNVETYASGLSDCYTFGPTFRAENSHTSRHLCEFWMIEPEISFATLEDDMDCAEDYLKFCLKYVLENNYDDMEFFEKLEQMNRDKESKGKKKTAGDVEQPKLIARLQQVIETPFKRLPYTEAVQILEDHIKSKKVKFEYPVSWGVDLQSEHEKYLTDKVFCGPVVVYNYPKDIKAFYMKLNDDNKTVQAMDVLVPGIGEVIGGSAREDRLDVLDRRIKEMNLEIEAYWWYRDLRKYGSVPHAGFGLGFERLVMMASGVENIKDVIPFPRAPGQAEF